VTVPVGHATEWEELAADAFAFVDQRSLRAPVSMNASLPD
jgi:hypothetical protein